MKKPILTKERGGYMLIEILVSLVIFTIVAVTSATALLAIVDANSKSQTLKSIMDNLSVAVENMSRSMRIGTDIKCLDVSSNSESQDPTECDDGTDGVTFFPQDRKYPADRVKYYFKSDANNNNNGTIYRYRDGVETALTAPEVTIDNVSFYVLAASSADTNKARVFMNINGKAGITAFATTPFNIQTSISQRGTEVSP